MGRAATRLAKAKALAESSVATILKNHAPSAHRDEWTARESDWRRHRKSLAISRGMMLGARDRDGLRWCEDPAAIGLRFVGFADELGLRSIDHSGWFTDSECQYELYRGAVYQWPARDGVARFVAGYRVGFNHGRGNWTDNDGESARLDFAVIKGDAGRESSWDDDDGKRDAAMMADGIAEHDAETAREYNDAWRAASRWQEAGETMAAERAAARQLVADMRAAIRAGTTAAASICKALRDQVRRHAEAWEEARAERDKIDDDFAFWPGAGLPRQSVAEFAALNF